MPYRSFRSLALALITGVVLAFPAHAAEAGSDETMLLFSDQTEPTASTGRIPRPISKIAENVTVITSDDISRINAHTLTDILATVPGLHIDDQRTPGSLTFFKLQGASSEHVLVLLDGVPQNDLSDVFPDIGSIRAQSIERVEIVKGAASAAWGSALGGVVNVVTKAPDPERVFGGSASASIGSRFTTDAGAQISGTVDGFGYYLSGGNIQSDGLVASNATNLNGINGKGVYQLPKGSVTLGLDYRDVKRGEFEAPIYNMRDSSWSRFFSGYLDLNYPLGDKLVLDILARDRQKRYEYWGRNFDNGDLAWHPTNEESVYGVTSKITWGDSLDNMVVGAEYEHSQIRQDETILQSNANERTFDRWAGFANAAASWGRFTLLPGIRIDATGIGGDYVSYSLGATFRLTDKTVVRAYGARGYSLPFALVNHGLQKVWTAQTGIESSEFPGLWLKGTLFYNDTWNIEVPNYVTGTYDIREQIKQGLEFEWRTVPVADISVSGGYTYVHARDRDTGDRLQDIPGHLLKVAINYGNRDWGVNGALVGNYAWTNARPDYHPADDTMLWDLHLTWKVVAANDLSPELFFSARNLFNGSQYWTDFRANPRRWFEGGVRFKF